MSIKMLCEPALARQFFNIMGSIVDEFRLHISKDGWKVAAVDPANVALINIDLPMFSRTILLLPESDIRRSLKKLTFYLDYKLQINALEFQRIVLKAAKVGEYLRLGFKHEEGSVIFTASTVDGNDLPWDATKLIFGWQSLRDGSRISSSSLFSLDYLCDIAEKITSETVWLHIGHDNPCILSFVLGRTGAVEYKIAPRVEDE